MFRYSLLLVVALGASAQAQTVSYQGTTFPEQDGWTRDEQLFPADRAIENGWLVQRADVVPQEPPFLDVSEQDFYRRSLSEFAWSDPFFIEWRMVTDGPRTGIPSASPAAIVAGGTSHAFYHFTIAEDQARLINADLSVLLVDIAPGVPHNYRLELYGTQSYRWLIDGQVVDSGIPEGPYPTADSEIVFGARAAGQTITDRWDYIRYGTIPEPATGALLLAGAATVSFPRRKKVR
ncbi:MAG: PEP-CTERM sorting domain-containing protein [Planctomycetota bacterium]